MAEFFSNEDIKNELESSDSLGKVTAFAGRKYPIEYLSSREFEILLYFIFKRGISLGIASEKYDVALLMKGTPERGRDIVLQKNGKNIGVVQCKRFVDLIQKPQLLREIIKFILHYLQDKSLITDINDFTYHFVALNGFNDKALELLQSFNSNIQREGNLGKYTEQVIEENESLKFESFEQVEASWMAIRGPLLEENHYYPFGLTMAGISD